MKDLQDINKTVLSRKKNFIGWLFFPISLFPLAALLTYDSASMPQVQIPAYASTNWIGPLGDSFSYYGCTYGKNVVKLLGYHFLAENVTVKSQGQ